MYSSGQPYLCRNIVHRFYIHRKLAAEDLQFRWFILLVKLNDWIKIK